MNSSITIERKRVDCNTLGSGWQREEVLRKSGISAGKVDVFYYSPTGKKIESKPQLARHLGDAIDISTFDFQTGKIVQPLPPPSISLYRCSISSSSNANVAASSSASAMAGNSGGSAVGAVANLAAPTNSSLAVGTISVSAANAIVNTSSTTTTATTPPSNVLKRKYKAQTNINSNSSYSIGVATTSSSANLRQHLEFSRALRTDVSLVPPIRQTASIFKQPVTVVRNHENTKVKHDSKLIAAAQEKPKQLFWEKRLEHLRACHASGEEFDNINLPKGIRTIGPNVNEQTVLQSLATALHVLNVPVTGQTSTKTEMIKNAAAFINPEQPLMQSVLVSEDDIRRQEDRVNVARRKLQEALKV